MQKVVKGSLGVANAFQVTEQTAGYDRESKKLFMYKEVLAVVVQALLEEYEGYTVEEVMQFIEEDSIEGEKEVTSGRTNTRIDGSTTAYHELNEKGSNFDVSFRTRNPVLSNQECHRHVKVNLHVDIEPQRDYRPGYPMEKRGIYYLARKLSAQLDMVTGKTDYGQLEKCYTIFICRNQIPKSEQMSISYYRIVNEKNIGSVRPRKADYDLMNLIIIRLGDELYRTDEADVLEFLTLLFYKHKDDFRSRIRKYIDVEEVLERLEGEDMGGLEEIFYYDGVEKGISIGRSEGISIGRSEGISEGINIGRSEGISIGRSEGINIGRSEGINIGRNEGIDIGRSEGVGETIKRMLERNVSEEDICRLTGYEMYQILEVKESM